MTREFTDLSHLPIPQESWDMSWMDAAYCESRIGTWLDSDPIDMSNVLSEPNEILDTKRLNRRIMGHQAAMNAFDYKRACLYCLGNGRISLRANTQQYHMCNVCGWYPNHRQVWRYGKRPATNWDAVKEVYDHIVREQKDKS